MRKPLHLDRRASGVLLHPTSLPGPHDCGDLGRAAHDFVDFLAASGQRWWQMLPVGPVDRHGCPYNSTSAAAGNPLLISLANLVQEGLLTRKEAKPPGAFSAARVEYAAVAAFRESRLRLAFAAFERGGGLEDREFRRFQGLHKSWLDSFALFNALKRAYHGRAWTGWPRALRQYRRAAVARAEEKFRADVRYEQFVQFLFFRQWLALQAHCQARRVGLIGDIPIFVSHDSADVWSRQELFLLDRRGRPKTVSGVPPDFFSRDGQLWGHPLYNWRRHRATNFDWWFSRFALTLMRFDVARIDHFLGFHRCWAVPGGAKTARRGRWLPSPGAELLKEAVSVLMKRTKYESAAARRRAGSRLLAEDLGLLTAGAAALRDRFGFPGMRVLQFAFGDPAGGRYHQPHNYPRHCVAYTGTHDNDTSVGWFKKLRAAPPAANAGNRYAWSALSEAERALRYLGGDGREIHWNMVRALLASPADTVIFPMQDVLGLGTEARMNVPGTVEGNWQWRMKAGALTRRLAGRLRELTETYERI